MNCTSNRRGVFVWPKEYLAIWRCSASCILMDNYKINIIHLESCDTPSIMHHDSPSHMELQASCLRWMVNAHKIVRLAAWHVVLKFMYIGDPSRCGITCFGPMGMKCSAPIQGVGCSSACYRATGTWCLTPDNLN